MNLFPSTFEKEPVAEKCCFKGTMAVGASPPCHKRAETDDFPKLFFIWNTGMWKEFRNQVIPHLLSSFIKTSSIILTVEKILQGGQGGRHTQVGYQISILFVK